MSEGQLNRSSGRGSSRRRWLILSHGFNMDGRAASQTITDKIPFLLESGVQLHVLSAITGVKDHRFMHQQIIAWGPAAFRFDFRHWFANRFGRGLAYKIMTPMVSILLAPFIALEKLWWGYSSQWSWALPAYVAGLRLIRAGKIDLIYSTGGAWSAHLAGLWLKKKTQIPWIAEIHDPLVIRTNEHDIGATQPAQADARKRHWLEQQICRHANLVWWFTYGALHFAKQRNPQLDSVGFAKTCMIIPGANPPSTSLSSQLPCHTYGRFLNICHFGSLANDRSLSDLLKVLPAWFQKYPKARQQLKIHIYGGSLDSRSKKILGDEIEPGVVIEHGRIEKDATTGQSGREQIIAKMRAADVLLLLHGEGQWCQEYIPSKLYDYFWTRRPVWAITNRNPQLDALLMERGAYLSAGINEIEATLTTIWFDWENKQLIEPDFQPITVEAAVKTIIEAVDTLT